MTAQTPKSSQLSTRWLVAAAIGTVGGVALLLWLGPQEALLYTFGFGLFLAAGKPFKKHWKLVYRGILPFGVVAFAVTWALDLLLAQDIKRPETRLVFSALVGVVAGLIVVWIVIEVWARARLHWLTIFNGDLDRAEALRFLRSEAFGLNYPVYMADGSQSKTTLDAGPGGFLAKAGGPGLIVAQHGCAVVLERNGQYTRVIKGVQMLTLFEQPKAVVDLRQQHKLLQVAHVLTLDGASVDIEMNLWYQIKRQGGSGATPGAAQVEPVDRRADLIDEANAAQQAGSAPPTAGDQFQVDTQDILAAVYQVDDWRHSIEAMTTHILRDAVGKHTLIQLLGRDEKRELLGRISLRNTVLHGLKRWFDRHNWGVEVVWVDIGDITVPEVARQRLLENWLAPLEVKIAEAQKEATIMRGEAAAVATSAQESARARASMQLINNILGAIEDAGLDREEAIDRMVNLRLIDALEKLASEHVNGLFMPPGLLEALLGPGRSGNDPST